MQTAPRQSLTELIENLRGLLQFLPSEAAITSASISSLFVDETIPAELRQEGLNTFEGLRDLSAEEQEQVAESLNLPSPSVLTDILDSANVDEGIIEPQNSFTREFSIEDFDFDFDNFDSFDTSRRLPSLSLFSGSWFSAIANQFTRMLFSGLPETLSASQDSQSLENVVIPSRALASLITSETNNLQLNIPDASSNPIITIDDPNENIPADTDSLEPINVLNSNDSCFKWQR